MKRRWLKYLLVLVVLVVLAEIALRIFLDNEQRVLYLEDLTCEYRLAPNQDVSRFHNDYRTNEYGMRSGPLRKTEKKRILLFGDSVLNGGTKITQDDLLNYELQRKLEQKYNMEIGAYNISAGSWGPENAYRYFEHYVDFDFDLIILVFSSDDYHDNMHHRKVVGTQPAWPDQQPYLALTDLYSGFIKPKVKAFFGNAYDYLEGFDDSPVNPGWDLFVNYARENGKKLLVYHHPNTSELGEKKYNDEGLNLETKLTDSGVLTVRGIEVEQAKHFLDDIHIDASGHAVIAAVLFDAILSYNLLSIEGEE
jgi:hypothetical protein